METKKQPIFRIRVMEIATKKSKMLTVYKNGKKHTLDEFAEIVKKKIKEV